MEEDVFGVPLPPLSAPLSCSRLAGIWKETKSGSYIRDDLDRAIKELAEFWGNNVATTFRYYISDDELNEYFE